MKKLLLLFIVLLTSVCNTWAQDGTVVATMSDLVTGAGFNNAKTVKENSIYSCAYYTYLGAIDISAVTTAYEGSGYVTVAMWIWGNSASGCLFGYGDQDTGVKYYINGATVKTTTKGVSDFTDQNLNAGQTRVATNQWNLIAFAIPAKNGTWGNLQARYYATATDGQFWSQSTGETKMKDPATDGKKCAIGSGNQGNAREAFNGIIANVTVIQSTALLNNSRIAALVGDAPSSSVWYKPAMGGRTWTWNTTNSNYDSSDGTAATGTPARTTSEGPVYRFNSVGTLSATSSSSVDTSDKGGAWVLGTQQNSSNVTVNIGRWAGSIDVETWQVANVSYSVDLKGTEPSCCSTVWVDGDLTFGSSRSLCSINDGGDQRWYIGENGIIHSSFTSVKKGSREWNFQIVVANDPQVGETDTRIVHTRTRKVMTWGADIHSNIDNVKVFHKGDDGTLTEKNTTNDTNFEVTYDANGMYVTYTCKGYFNTNDPNYSYTYSSGVGTSESRVSINHNGGTVNLTGAEETHYLTGSNSATQTTVNFDGTTVSYDNELGIGTATYNINNTQVTTPKFITSQGLDNRPAVVNLTGNTRITVTGSSNVDTNQSSIMIGHWNGSSNLTLSGTAQIEAVDAQLLVGKTGNTQTITLNGSSNITAKGIKTSSNATGTNTLNLNGGSLTLGEYGITSYADNRTISVNVTENSTITASASTSTLPISQPITVAAGKTLTIDGNESAAVTLTTNPNSLTNNGTIILDGAGLGGSERITTKGVFTIQDLKGNELTNSTNGYALVGNGICTLNLEGICDFTKKSDGTTPNSHSQLGYGGGSTINIKEGANVTTAAIYNSSTLSSNTAVVVESDATLTCTTYVVSTSLTNNGTITAPKLWGPVTLAAGSTTTLSDATPFDYGAVTVSGDATLNLTASTATLNQAITVAADKTLTIDGKSNNVVLTGAVTNNGTIIFKNATLTANLDDRSLENYTFTSCTATLQFVETTDEYKAGGFTITNIPAGVTVKVKKYGTTEYTTETPVDGTITISHSVEVSGSAAWLDYTFNLSTIEDNTHSPADRVIDNAGNAGTTGQNLTIDTGYNTDNSYNEDGTLKVMSTPYRGITWPTNYTVAVAGNVPDVENGCLVAFGSTTNGSMNYLAIIRGANQNEIKLVKGNGFNAYQVISTMTAANATALSHLVVFTKNGNTFTVYLDGIQKTQVEYSETLGTGFQIGSIHGGVSSGGNNTGIERVSSMSDAIKEKVFAKAIRVYDYVISGDQMDALTTEFPYTSFGGKYSRTITTNSNLSATNAWLNEGTQGYVDVPVNAIVDAVTYYPDVEITTSAASTLTVNADMDTDNITFEGAGKLTIVSDGSHNINIHGSVTANGPVSLKYGEINLTAVPFTIGESGSVEFDFSDYDFSDVITSTDYPVTGNTSDYGAKVTGVYPPRDLYHTYTLAHNGSTNSYYLTVEPTVKLKQDMAISLVTPYQANNLIGTGIGKYTISLGETHYTTFADFGTAVMSWATLGDCVEPTIEINQPTSAFYRIKSGSKYLQDVRKSDEATQRTLTDAEGSDASAGTIFYLDDDTFIGYKTGYGFENSVCQTQDTEHLNTQLFTESAEMGKYTIQSQQGTCASAAYNEGYWGVDGSDLSRQADAASGACWALESVTLLPITFRGEYASLYSPVDLTIPDNANLKVYTGTLDGAYLRLNEVTGTLPANTGVILHLDNFSETTTINFPILSTSTSGSSDLTGTVAAQTVTALDKLVLGYVDDTWGIYSYDNTTLNGFKAYMDMPATPVKGFTFSFGDETGIKAIANSQEPMANSPIYNLAGQRMSRVQKGVNIVNGKKVLVK